MNQGKAQDGGTPVLEWISAGVGLVLTVAMLGFIGWQAWTSTGQELPAVELRVRRILPAGDGWVVEVAALNHSPATAAAVQIEGTLTRDGQTVAESQATFDYVPGNSEREGGLFFREDPNAFDLEVRTLGYARP
ncbi:hypothetical protein [Paracoccus shandongensis]|uniref:hypothetical protein n=1 Tax=Paracoccus shandongensis TaxID=2816048 RepID=UPI001A8C9126|nr:hypothetical protein [Paracoccus shandongensis]